MIKAIVLSLTMLVPGVARAGCANYTDGSLSTPAPKVATCFEGKCEETTVDFACGNIHGAMIGFANGWRVDFIVEGDGESANPNTKTITSRNGTTVANDALTCKIDEQAIPCLGADDI